MNTKANASPAELIAWALLNGESVDMGYWTATFADAIYSACERDDEFANKLLTAISHNAHADAVSLVISDAVHEYAERNEVDWITANEAQRGQEAERARSELREDA